MHTIFPCLPRTANRQPLLTIIIELFQQPLVNESKKHLSLKMILHNTSSYQCLLRSALRAKSAPNLHRRRSTLITLPSPRPTSSFPVIPRLHRRSLSTMHILPLRRSRLSTLLPRNHDRKMSALLSPRHPITTNLSILKKTPSIRAVYGGGTLGPAAILAAGTRGMKVMSSVKKRCEGCRVRCFFFQGLVL